MSLLLLFFKQNLSALHFTSTFCLPGFFPLAMQVEFESWIIPISCVYLGSLVTFFFRAQPWSLSLLQTTQPGVAACDQVCFFPRAKGGGGEEGPL